MKLSFFFPSLLLLPLPIFLLLKPEVISSHTLYRRYNFLNYLGTIYVCGTKPCPKIKSPPTLQSTYIHVHVHAFPRVASTRPRHAREDLTTHLHIIYLCTIISRSHPPPPCPQIPTPFSALLRFSQPSCPNRRTRCPGYVRTITVRYMGT